MKKKLQPKTKVIQLPDYQDLRVLGTKIKAIGEIIRGQGASALPPYCERDLHMGLGMLLSDLGEEVIDFSRELEKVEIQRAQVERDD